MIDLNKNFNTTKNTNIPELKPGDQVSVHVRIKEGDRERIQEFKGTVIRSRKGGNNANFTVRRTASNGIGVERTFLTLSPSDRQSSGGTPYTCPPGPVILPAWFDRKERPTSNRNLNSRKIAYNERVQIQSCALLCFVISNYAYTDYQPHDIQQRKQVRFPNRFTVASIYYRVD